MLLILSIFRILYIRHRQVLDLAKLTLHFVQTRSPSCSFSLFISYEKKYAESISISEFVLWYWTSDQALLVLCWL